MLISKKVMQLSSSPTLSITAKAKKMQINTASKKSIVDALNRLERFVNKII